MSTEDGCKLLLEEIDRRIPYKELGLREFSSRRLYNYREENEEKYLEIILKTIYGLLINNSNLSVQDVFYQYDEKMKIVSQNIAEVAAYLYEYMKNVDGIKFSVGRQGLANTARRTNRNAPLSPYQEKLVQAVAFGASYEKLESGDYEHAKRLLFIP